MGKQYNVAKAAIWYTIGNILIKGVSFFVLPIFTNLMGTEDYGIFSIYTSYVTIFEVIILLGLSATVRMAKFNKELSFDRYMGTIACIPVFITLISMVLINGLSVFGISSVLSMRIELWNFLFITSACSAVSGIIGARLVIDAEYKKYMAFSLINVISSVGVSLLLCYTIFRYHNIYMARVWGMCLSSIISCLFILKTSHTKICFEKACFKQAIIWGIPLLFHTLATVILTQSDRIVIKEIEGYSNAGIYSIAVTMISIPLTLYTSFESAWAPWLFDKLEKKDYESTYKLNNKYIVFFATIIAGFMLICPDVIHVFTNKNYWDSVYSLVPLSISVFGEMIYSLPTNVEYFNKKTLYITTGTIATTVINIILDIIFVFNWGYIGAAYATSISKIILFLFHWYFSKKIDKNDVFSPKVIGICLAALIILNVFILYNVNSIVPRWIVTVIICSLFLYGLLKNKDDLRMLIKK